MIKTFVYNDFNFPRYNINKAQVIQDIDDFIKSGGNLNYPIKDDNKLSQAFSFLENILGVEFVTSLVKKGHLNSPGEWILDNTSHSIIEPELFGGYWYRDHADKYREILADGYKTVCNQFIDNPIYTSFVSINAENNLVKNTLDHPLLSILLKIPFKELVEVFIQTIPEAKELLHQVYNEKMHITYLDSLVEGTDSQEILVLFFKYNIVPLNVLLEEYNFDEVIKYAIYHEDFEFIELLKSQSENPQYISILDKDNSMYDSFLRRSTSPEMAKILIDAGCSVIKENNQYDSFLLSKSSFPIHKFDTIKFIMEYVPLDYMGKYQNTFWEYLQSAKDIQQFKTFANFIVSQGFPIEKYDIFNICPVEDLTTKLQTCLDVGANPNSCRDLIHHLISKRDIGTFKAIQKTKLLNLYSSDAIYYFLESTSYTKTTLDLIDKADNADINNLTSFGKPAWFSAHSKDTLNKILKKITSFNQKDSTGHNWITHYYSQNLKDSHEIAPLVLEIASLEESKNKKLLALTHKENTSNLLHYGFTFSQYKTKELREEFITIVKSFDTINLNELLSGLNENGLFPIDCLILSKSTEGVWNKSFWDTKLDTLFKLAEYNLDYDKKNINGKSLIDSIRDFYKIDSMSNNFIEPVEKAYTIYTLYKKLDSQLVPNNRKSSTVKI